MYECTLMEASLERLCTCRGRKAIGEEGKARQAEGVTASCICRDGCGVWGGVLKVTMGGRGVEGAADALGPGVVQAQVAGGEGAIAECAWCAFTEAV